MAREEFLENVRLASTLLAPPRVDLAFRPAEARDLAERIDRCDLWLTPKLVEGFAAEDFASWPLAVRKELAQQVKAFLAVARQVPPDQPATHAQSAKARKSLERVCELVGAALQSEWRTALDELMTAAARAAARQEGWHASADEKELCESLLGRYRAPRLSIRGLDFGVVLDPIARFCSGGQGVVDLAMLPTFETERVLAYRGGAWWLATMGRDVRRTPFTEDSFLRTLRWLARRSCNATTRTAASSR